MCSRLLPKSRPRRTDGRGVEGQLPLRPRIFFIQTRGLPWPHFGVNRRLTVGDVRAAGTRVRVSVANARLSVSFRGFFLSGKQSNRRFDFMHVFAGKQHPPVPIGVVRSFFVYKKGYRVRHVCMPTGHFQLDASMTSTSSDRGGEHNACTEQRASVQFTVHTRASQAAPAQRARQARRRRTETRAGPRQLSKPPAAGWLPSGRLQGTLTTRRRHGCRRHCPSRLDPTPATATVPARKKQPTTTTPTFPPLPPQISHPREAKSHRLQTTKKSGSASQ
jgi:hypothetical protein